MVRSIFSKLITCLLVLAFLLTPASAAVMAIDLGSEFLKISIIKPGRIPISIVTNEMSKRKSPAAVAFVNGDRLVGDEALALAIRYPDRVYTRIRDLLGKDYDDESIKRVLKDSKAAFSVVQAPNRTTVAITTDTGDIYSAEELAASLLEYAKTLATAAADGELVTDTVLVVPAYFTPSQRRALMDAASLAGLNVLSIVHSHAAAALQYGIERDFTNKTEHVMFYELGNSAAQAALVTYSSFLSSDGKNQSISQLEVRDIAWVEHGVGSDALESVLIDHFAKEHSGGAEEVLSSPRAVAKLRKQVKRTKEILSANTEAPISVEELLSGVDFRSRISREQFEEAAGAVWERAVAPVKALLERNNLTVSDLSAFELLGGSSRVPKVKAALSEALGGRALDMHIDADEAVVLGAGLVAANLSTIFRLRTFGLTDKVPYRVNFTHEGAIEATDSNTNTASTKDEDKSGDVPQRVLVPVLKKMPTKRAITLHNVTSDGFSVRLMFDNEIGAVLPCCRQTKVIGSLNVSGISAVVEKHGFSGKVAVHTGVDQNGMFVIDTVDASVDVIEEVPVITGGSGSDNTTTNTTNSTNSTSNADKNSTADGSTTESPKDGDTATASSKKADTTKESKTKKEMKTRKRIIRVPLNTTGGLSYPGLTPEQMKQSRRTLRTLRDRDFVKRDTAKSRNDLESYIISTRDSLENSERLKAVSREEERDGILKSLSDAEEWLYGDGDTAAGSQYKEKLAGLNKKVQAIERRAAEGEARPALIKATRDFLELSTKTANSWPTIKPWLNETDVESFKNSMDEFSKWLDNVVGTQEKREPHEDPVFTAQEVANKVDVLRRQFSRLNNKPKPVEKKAPPVVESAKKNDTDDDIGMKKKVEGGEAPMNETDAGSSSGLDGRKDGEKEIPMNETGAGSTTNSSGKDGEKEKKVGSEERKEDSASSHDEL